MVKDYQRILFPYAYNILGSAEDARDAIQDVLSSFVTTKRDGIDHEKNYLIKSVVNRSINIRNRRKKITSDAVWLPEPLATEEADTNINLRDIVSYSMLYLLEQLTPKERAAFILKESFDYSHEEIADVLSGTVEGSRKLLSRAKQKLSTSKALTKSAPVEKATATLLEQYVNAIRGRDTKTLESLLTLDIAFQADGGDTVSVMKKLCHGSSAVAELLLAVYDKYQTTYSVEPTTVNHQPALLYFENETLRACQVFDIRDNKIHQIHTVVDPVKLVSLNSV